MEGSGAGHKMRWLHLVFARTGRTGYTVPSVERLRTAKTWLRRALLGLLLAALGVGAFVARCDNARQTFIEGRIYFLDGDCYARMTRARMILEHPGMVIHHHDFENFPDGVQSHTTAPFDYAIVVLKWVLDGVAALFGETGRRLLPAEQTLDLAGAIISPLCGAAACVYLGWWARREMRRALWVAVPLFFALCPILVHGTLLGRPDHQAPLILFLTVAITAELSLLRGRRRGQEEDYEGAEEDAGGAEVVAGGGGVLVGDFALDLVV